MGCVRPVDRTYVKKCYDRFARQFFPDDVLPEFESLDFEFSENPNEMGSIDWDEHGMPSLSLDPILRKIPSFLRAVLLHEMTHLKLGANTGHGKAFYDEATRICGLGGIRVVF